MAVATDLPSRLFVAPEVAAALAAGTPVVALESTLISHGLPFPQNRDVALASEAAVRSTGAVPATVAIHDGRILVGLDAAALTTLATAPAGSVRKAARPSLAHALAVGGWAATTVSATMIAAHAAGIRVFATGGIGGVHRGAFGVGGDPGRLLRPRGAGPDAGRGRVCRSQGDPGRPGHARVPRDARRAGRRDRPGRAARLLRPFGRRRGAGVRAGRRGRCRAGGGASRAGVRVGRPGVRAGSRGRSRAGGAGARRRGACRFARPPQRA